MNADTYSLRIAQIIEETPEAKTFVLQPTGNVPFIYRAGQFLTLIFDRNGQEIRRSFSFSSTPRIDALPAITIKRVANGLVSRPLLDYAQVGDMLTSSAPAGRFVLPEDDDYSRDIFLIGAGSGITPLFALLKELCHLRPKANITLIYSNRSVESTIFYDQIRKLQAAFADRLRVIFLWGNHKNLRLARLNNSLLEELVNRHLKYRREDALFYTCGPVHFMLMVRITLYTMGFDKDSLRKEYYVVDTKPVTAKQYPPQHVRFAFKGKEQVVEVRHNETILEAGILARLPLPYNCRSGQCGACVALCLSGTIEMEYNEVLTDEEVALGQTLTCVAHPLTAGVSIQW